MSGESLIPHLVISSISRRIRKMREEDSNWFAKWEEELPKPEELMPLSQTLITPDLAIAFDIPNPTSPNPQSKQQQTPLVPSSQPNSSAEFESAELNGTGGGDEPARTLKRPRLVWTPQLHKRFVDAVAHLGIKNAVPKTIMQLMSVDGLTRENVASHLQKYRLYLKRMQGLSNEGPSSSDHLFASTPVPQSLQQSGVGNGNGNSGNGHSSNGHMPMPMPMPMMYPPQMVPMPMMGMSGHGYHHQYNMGQPRDWSGNKFGSYHHVAPGEK